LRGWKRDDPAPARVKPLPVGLIHYTFSQLMDDGSARCQSLAWLCYVAFYFLMRPGEYCDSGEAAHPFRWCDVTLRIGDRILDTVHCTASSLRANDFATLTFTTQKSGVRGEIVGHGASGALHACPCRALAELILLLRQHDAPYDAPLASYREQPGGPLLQLTSPAFTAALRGAARLHGAEFGLEPSDVTASCFRTTGAMALFCGGVDSSRIRLLGRWQSWTMLRYLHLQARQSTRGMSERMLRGGNIQLLAPAQVPDANPEPPDVPPAVVPNPQEDFEQD